MNGAIRTAKHLFFGYALALLIFELANADALDSFLGILLWCPFQVGPAACAAILVRLSPGPRSARLFVAVENAVLLSTLAFLIDTRAHPDSWSALGASMTLGLFGPLYQYAFVALAAAFALLLGWRSRDDWPDRPSRQSTGPGASEMAGKP